MDAYEGVHGFLSNSRPHFSRMVLRATILVAELRAIREGIHLAIEGGYLSITVERDSILFINYLKHGLGCLAPEWMLVDEILWQVLQKM